MPILLKVFQKIAEEETLPNSFYKATITLIPKQDKDSIHTQKTKLQANITMNIVAKVLNKILTSRIQKHLKNIIYQYQGSFVPVMQGFSNICKSINVIKINKDPQQRSPWLGYIVFEGISLLCPPEAGKAIKLFF